MAIRAEESTWFPYSYIGSKAALGLLPASALDIPRADTGRTLAQHMADLGCDPESRAPRRRASGSRRTCAATSSCISSKVRCWSDKDIPVALVTGIRGSFRYRDARVIGEYGHSGAVPRAYRHDAVVAAADFVISARPANGRGSSARGTTSRSRIGKLFTDPQQHAFSKIAGEVGMCIDVRSHSQAEPCDRDERGARAGGRDSGKHGVRFELGALTGSEPAAMERRSARPLHAQPPLSSKIPHIQMASGAGHDAAMFASAGVPSAMIFVRNQNGSHNPDEAMRMEDFELAVRVLARGVAGLG